MATTTTTTTTTRTNATAKTSAMARPPHQRHRRRRATTAVGAGVSGRRPSGRHPPRPEQLRRPAGARVCHRARPTPRSPAASLVYQPPPPLPPGLKKRPQSDDACARSHGSILRPQAHTGCAAAAHAPSSQRAPVREAPFTPCLPRARPAPTGCGPFRCRGGGARGGRLPLLAQPLAITPSGDDVNSPSIVRGIDRINLTAPTPTPAAMVRGRARGRSCLFRGSGADA